LTQIPVGNYYWPILVSILVSSSFSYASHAAASASSCLRTLRLIECLNLISILGWGYGKGFGDWGSTVEKYIFGQRAGRSFV